MSKQKDEKTEAVAIDIGDLEEVVGGVAMAVAAVNERVLTSAATLAPGVTVAYDPDTCPTSPGGPVSTCMCPSSAIGARIGAVILPE